MSGQPTAKNGPPSEQDMGLAEGWTGPQPRPGHFPDVVLILLRHWSGETPQDPGPCKETDGSGVKEAHLEKGKSTKLFCGPGPEHRGPRVVASG